MERLKKKKKYYFPYKIFSIESKSKSQTNIIKDKLTLNSLNSINKNGIKVNDYVKKLKSTILSNKIFSKYMDNYIGQTQDFCFKSPECTVYPMKKNFQYLPIDIKRNLSVREVTSDERRNNENQTNSVIEKPYGYKYKNTRIRINNKDYYHHNSAEKLKSKLFINFSEGMNYSEKVLKAIGLSNIDISNNSEIIKSNFNYLHESLININLLENFTSSKSIDYKIKNNFTKEDVLFNINVFSLCFNFYEIEPSQKSDDIEDNKENKENAQNVKKQKLFLPFKLLPFFYLLNYSSFKSFISEIIYYDKKAKCMNFNQKNFRDILRKYSYYLRNVYQRSTEDTFKDITFYRNEFIYDKYYDWIVIHEKEKEEEEDDSDDNDKNNKRNINESVVYKMKISFPKIVFEEKKNNIKIINHLNKNVIIRILKMNFIDWEKLILFDLFSNKKFRYLINNILNGSNKFYNKKIILYEKMIYNNSVNNLTNSNINNILNNSNKNNNNYEFFISEAIRGISYYYIFTPNIILILRGETKKHFQKINLNLKESRKLFQLSKYWGALNTLFKCMYKDEMSNKIYFKLNILDNISKELYKTIRNEEIYFQSHKNMSINTTTSIQKDNYIRYKTNNFELLLSECLLNVINITINDLRNFYFKVPKKLLNTILTTSNNMKIVHCIIDCCNEILNNENEVDILREERIMGKKIYDLSRGGSPNEKHNNNNNFLKTFSKNKTFFIKNGSNNNNKNLYAKSFNRQKSNILENQKSSFIQILEKKYPDLRTSLKERRNISNFTDEKEKENENENENEKEIQNLISNLPNIKQDKKASENNIDLNKIKSSGELRKNRLNRTQTNNYSYKSSLLK